MPTPRDRWLDGDAGPVVRPYALTGGRTRHGGERFDLVATVTRTRALIPHPSMLEPEHLAILSMARRPVTVADLASGLDLPVGVVRILLADLRDFGLIVIRPPVNGTQRHDEHILREVLDGLRRL